VLLTFGAKMSDVLVVPVVNGLDVAENDFVFAFFEIVGYGRRQTTRIADIGRLPSIDTQTHQGHVTVDDLAKITDVVPLRFHQFLVGFTKTKNKIVENETNRNGMSHTQEKKKRMKRKEKKTSNQLNHIIPAGRTDVSSKWVRHHQD
jgi:hypothetical protein